MAANTIRIDTLLPADVSENVQYVDFTSIREARNELTDWGGLIDRVAAVHNRVFSLVSGGVIQRFPQFQTYFEELINWLNGQSATSSFIGIAAPTGGLTGINQEMLNSLRDSWVPNLESAINNDQQFLSFEQIHNEIKTELSKLGAIKADSSLKDVIDKTTKQINNLEESYKKSLSEEKNKAIGELRLAIGLDEWVKYYEEVESDYTLLIEGTHRTVFRTPFSKEKTVNGDNKWCLQTPMQRTENLRSKFATISAWKFGEARKRFLWFFALFLVVLVPTVLGLINTSSVFGITNPFFFNTSVDNPDYKLLAVEKLRYLPLLVIVSYGYAFTNKNYRILSNLREQYRHRKTVAKTLQGIITAIDEDTKNTDIRGKLVEVGAKAMFELKTIGHLTKKESDNSPFAEIVQTISPR